MEPFCLYDISAIIYTKSAERIMSPMVAELYHLIIAIELGEVNNEALAGLEETADELVKATEQLAYIARRLAEESDDEILKQEMKLSSESLLISGKNILLVAQKLLIQPNAGNGIDELIVSAKRILVETIKVLQTEDDLMFRKVIQAAHWLLDCLFSLESTENISAMLAAFRNFSEVLLLLTSLTEKLLRELKVSPHREHLSQTLKMLKKCIPMLHIAKLSNLKYPHDQQVKLSKTYIFDVVENVVKEMISLLKNDAGGKKLHGRNCLFPQHLQKLLQLLSRPQPIHLYESKFDVLVASVVFYCMLLADSSRATIKLKLVKICYRLLKLRKVIAMDISTMVGFPVESQLEESMKEKSCSMRAELEHLNQAVQMAVLYQILDSFAETKEPLRRLIEAAVESSSQAKKGGFLKELQPHITAFFSHSIQMLKAANLILVTCIETETIEDIEDCVDYLNKLLATMPLLLSKMSHNHDNEDISEKLHSLRQVWSSTLQRLLMCFDKVIDLREFLDVSVQEIVGHKECSEKALADQHLGEFSCHASSLCKQAVQVVEFVIRYVDRVRDPIFRNGLLVLIRQLENAILLVNMAKDQCMASRTTLQTKNIYSKSAKHLIETARNLRKGLDECSQPDILSPLRENIRKLDTSKHLPTWVSLRRDSLERSSQNTIKECTTDHSEVLEEFSGRSFPVHSFPTDVSQENISFDKGAARKADLHPLVNELITATKTQNIAKLNGACSDLLELSTCCTHAAEEALQVAKPPVLEKLFHYREIVALTTCLISLAREIVPNPTCSPERFLQMAASLSKRINEVKQCLIAVASSWYCLSKQLFCIVLPCDFLHNTETMDEIMQMLETIVQLAGKSTFIDHDEKLPAFPELHETFLKVQAKFTCVQARTKHLLEKTLPGINSHSNISNLESFDGNCILWSVTVQTFLDIVDQFIGRDVLSLSELKTKLKYQVCLQSTMAAVSKSSFRLQMAAKLSFPLCADHKLMNEMVALKEQMQILTEALLQVADVLSVSPLPAHNLSVRFEFLQRELALTTKVLLLRLSGINTVYLNSIQSVIRLAQIVTHGNKQDGHQSNQEAFGKNAGHLMVNVQMVKRIIRDAFENPASIKGKDNLLSSVERLLLLTDEVTERAGKLQSQIDKEHLLVDSLLHEWSTEAGYLVTQLQSTEGISKTTLDLVRRCLQNEGEHAYSSQPFCKTAQYTAIDNGKHQNPAAPSHRPIKTGQKASPTWAINKMQPRSLLRSGYQLHQSDRNLTASPTASSEESEKWWHDGYPISQVIKQMTTQMSYMAQFLKRKGPITTKEQLIACATQIISGGQALLKFAGIVAKNCLDERCATELRSAIEQTKTISYQLSIISRVNASTGKSRLSAEHLVSNAQNLIQAAFQILKAAEAACVTGLQQLPPNSEEAEVAAFCRQWRKRLWWHRVKEAYNTERDELGLRKTGSWTEPSFATMIHELSAQYS